MESALIVSSSEKGTAFFADILTAAQVNKITVLKTCSEARRALLDRDFDLVIVNAMLKDESGESFSRQVAGDGLAQVILVVKNQYFDEVSAICENDGVLTISKPVNKTVLWSALTLAKSAQSRLKRVQAENVQLKQKIEDIKIIDRAKYMLISYLDMNEQDAHRYIEKQAMDMRTSRRAIAERILKTYES
ncbi:MAG: ANTAR domain-containing protein [Oscillospiraceae bacterium]|nr:ANTAR domain-containing protein [Oscillospiraceae bacterium]